MTLVKACIECQGDGWAAGPAVEGWPTIRPCSECRRSAFELWRLGAYRPDGPSTGNDPHLSAIADRHAGHIGRLADVLQLPFAPPPWRENP